MSQIDFTVDSSELRGVSSLSSALTLRATSSRSTKKDMAAGGAGTGEFFASKMLAVGDALGSATV